MHRRQLPVLNPCHENWDEMDGDTKRRHCESCDKDVINLSAMSEPEVKKIVDAARSKKTCVRYRVGADGMVMFAPNGAPVASPIFGIKPIALGLGLLVGAAAIPVSSPAVMGEIAPPPPAISVPLEVKGELKVEEPVIVTGEIAPPPVEKKPKKKKKVAPPEPPPPPHREIMGDLSFED